MSDSFQLNAHDLKKKTEIQVTREIKATKEKQAFFEQEQVIELSDLQTDALLMDQQQELRDLRTKAKKKNWSDDKLAGKEAEVVKKYDKLRKERKAKSAKNMKLAREWMASHSGDPSLLPEESAGEWMEAGLREKVASWESKRGDIRNVAIFRFKNEAFARDLLLQAEAGNELIEGTMEKLKTESLRLAAITSDSDYEKKAGELPELLTLTQEMRERIRMYSDDLSTLLSQKEKRLAELSGKGDVKDYVKEGEEEAVKEMERQAFAHGVSTIMEETGLSRQEAEQAFVEERMKAKRPYTLLHMDETKEKNKASYDDFRYSEDEEDLVGTIKSDWRGKYGKTPLPLDLETANRMAVDYVNQSLKEPNAYEIRVPHCNVMKMILDSGRFRTQVETHNDLSYGGTGQKMVKLREDFTQKKYGTDKNLLPKADYEVYGYLSDGNLQKECDLKNEENRIGKGVGVYGQVIVRLKKERMKYRTTVTIGDSLDGQRESHPMLMEEKKDIYVVNNHGCEQENLLVSLMEDELKKKAGQSVDPPGINNLLKRTTAQYVELQFHGGITVEDIESITLIGDYEERSEQKQKPDREMDPELKEKCRKLGIKTFFAKDGKVTEV